MKYFKTYLSGTSAYDDIDISVHCDVHIFDWLMQYVKALHSKDQQNRPKLDTKSVVSILISSEFLEMGKLVTECLNYVHDNINSIIKMPIDLNCINTKLLARLSKMFTVDELETVLDKRNKIIGKLWMKKLEVMLEDSKKSIRACKYCHKVFAVGFLEVLECSKAKPFIDFHGNVIARHEPHDDKAWSMRVYIKSLRSKKNLSWCQVYWKIWGLTHGLYCKVSDTFFPLQKQIFHCTIQKHLFFVLVRILVLTHVVANKHIVLIRLLENQGVKHVHMFHEFQIRMMKLHVSNFLKT